jgi:leucyl-tRNA synthetase
MQKNWIGRSEGADVDFPVAMPMKTELEKNSPPVASDMLIKVFTTRPDTLFGATYMVLAPEHPLLNQIISKEQKSAVEKYVELSKGKSELERTALEKVKTGEFTGGYAINPATKTRIPIWIADYVLSTYGTGAIMAVPAHDQRDFDFAKKYELPIVKVINDEGDKTLPYVRDGRLMNSGKYDTVSSPTARPQMIKEFGTAKVQYKLRDWLISRQRYWGAPIPIIYCEKCGMQPVPEKHLPVDLPDDVDFRPTGEPPLARSKKFNEVTCPKCDGPATRDHDTMDTFVDSSWYYFRFTDPHNDQAFADKAKMKEWLPVDTYVGGAEHAVMHLLYARFVTKALSDLRFVTFDEPFLKLRNQGLILGPDGEKMSKSRGNVINPDEVIAEFGADAFRMYEMFMGPLEEAKPWNTNSIVGLKRFLDKVWRYQQVFEAGPDNSHIHKLIKKVTSDIENFKFNTAIAAFMGFLNENKKMSKANWETFLIILAPFAPHITEELWALLGNTDSIHKQQWPSFDEKSTHDAMVQIVVQINGKRKGVISAVPGLKEEESKKLIDNSELFTKLDLKNKKIIKVIFVEDKLVNFVVE